MSDEDFVPALVASGPRKIVSISLRGRGQSGAPETGWKPVDHHGDIMTVMDSEDIQKAFLIGWSVGGAYSIGFALSNPERVLGIAIGDYFPFVPPFSSEWLAQVKDSTDIGEFHPDAPARIVADAKMENYAQKLGKLDIPLLILRGTKDDALLEEEALVLYEKAPNKRIVAIDSGHFVFEHPQAREACVEFVEVGV